MTTTAWAHWRWGCLDPGARRPDWYADPMGRHALRFWDGAQWTERISDAGRVGTDPVDVDLAEFLSQRGGDPRARWPGWVAALSVGVGLVAIVLAGVAARLADTGASSPAVPLAVGSVTLYSILLACCWAVRRSLGTQRGMAFDFGLHFRWGDIGWGFVASLVGRIAAVLLMLPFAFADEDFVVPDAQRVEGIERTAVVLVAFTVSAFVLAPIFEELFFRGLLQRSLENVVHTVWAIAIASLLFGLAHISVDVGRANVGTVAATGAAGAVFGVTAHITRRLGCAIAAHAAFNLIPVMFVWTV